MKLEALGIRIPFRWHTYILLLQSARNSNQQNILQKTCMHLDREQLKSLRNAASRRRNLIKKKPLKRGFSERGVRSK